MVGPERSEFSMNQFVTSEPPKIRDLRNIFFNEIFVLIFFNDSENKPIPEHF